MENVHSFMVEEFAPITQESVQKFAEICGDFNRIHFDEEYAAQTIFKKPIVHGMLVASYISASIARTFPGAIYKSQLLEFKAPVYIGDKLNVHIIVMEQEKKNIKISTTVYNPVKDLAVVTGMAELRLP